jgi:uncharacterized protein (PEP-CTERM system associated)
MLVLIRWLTAVAVLLFLTGEASGSWRGTTGLRTSVIFTDNLFLTPDDKTSGEVVQVRPYVATARDGSRLRVRFNYGPSLLVYPSNSELNDVQHTLNARLNAELIERYFFVDVNANANQALINPRVNSGFDRLSNPDAFTQRTSIRITPRIVLPVLGGRFASVRISPGLGYNFTAATAGDGGRESTPTSDTSVRIVSGPAFTNLPWSVNWRRRIFDTDTGDGLGEFTTRVGYVFSPKYRFDVILGYDDGSNAYRASDGETRGARWETIFRWTPNTRARFSFGVGERYFGTTYRFDGSYRHKRWVFRSNYRVSIQTASTVLEEQEVVPVLDLFGNPIENPFAQDEVLTTTVTTPTLIEDTFLRDQFTLQSQYSKGRNSATLRWFVTRRDYNESDLDTLDNQLQFRYSRTLSTRLRASAILNLWDHSEQSDSSFDYFQDALDLVVRYQVGPRTNLGVRIGRLNRDADRSEGDFSENRASLDFNVRF